MITQMSQEIQAKENDTARNTFEKILNAAKPYLNIIPGNKSNNIVKGILETQETGYRATLIYYPEQKAFSLIIRFQLKQEVSMPRLMILLRLQNYTAIGSCSINLDTENFTLRVKSHAILPAHNVVRSVVVATLRDTVNVLEDDDFQRFITETHTETIENIF